ncbi:MAG: tetratricopeptide repeat protein [bacterium]|nr:MAG: tetratricopeptide repeat protein [bacterium]
MQSDRNVGNRRNLRLFMAQWLRLLTMVTAVSAALFLLSPAGESDAFRNVEKGGEVPDFTLSDIAGQSHTLSAQRGKVVILCFVKEDQDRSIKALNGLTRVHGILKDSGLVVYAVASKTEDPASLEALREKLDLQYPILLDRDQKIYGEYGLFTFPATMFVDREGRFAFEYSSYGSDYEQTVTDKAKVMLGLMSEDDFSKTAEKTEIEELSPEAKEAQRSLQMAKVLLDRGFGTKAMPKIEKALELDPTLLEARLLAGEILLEAGNHQDARAHFEKALEINPKSNEARVGIGAVLVAEGDLDGAEAELQKAVMLNPDPAPALYQLGQVYEKKGDIQKAMETYRDGLEKLLKKSSKGK